MSNRIQWDSNGQRFYELGASRGVLYIPNARGRYDAGYGWNGLTGVTKTPSGAEAKKIYADDQVYATMISTEELGGTIQAYQSPVQFDQCDGTLEPVPGVAIGQQSRRTFGLCWRTIVGNDIDGLDHAYKIHIAYGALASPSERAYETVNESPEGMDLSWEFTTTPVEIYPPVEFEGRTISRTSSVVIDSRRVSPAKMKEITDILYGTESTMPRLPDPRELLSLIGVTRVEAVPAAPTFDLDSKTITIPTTTGVEYTILGEPAVGAVVITEHTVVEANVTEGYKLPEVAQTVWVFRI